MYTLGIFSAWVLVARPSLGGPVCRGKARKTVWSLSRLLGSIVQLTASDLSCSAARIALRAGRGMFTPPFVRRRCFGFGGRGTLNPICIHEDYTRVGSGKSIVAV